MQVGGYRQHVVVGKGLSAVLIGEHESCAKGHAEVGSLAATLTLEPQPSFISFSLLLSITLTLPTI